jgi:hypothetical protein
MKPYNLIVLFILLAIVPTGATAQAQAVPQTPQEREIERAQELIRRYQLQLQVDNFQARSPQGGVRGGGLGPAEPQIGGRVVVRENRSYTGGAWWTNTALVERLGLTDDQKAKIERAFENHRDRIMSSTEALEKEEAQLARMLEAESIDRNGLHAQIDRVIQARGEVERVNSAMTLEMREALTRAQWIQLPQPAGNVRIIQLPEGAGQRGAGGRGGRGGAPPQTGTPQPGGRRGPGGQQ